MNLHDHSAGDVIKRERRKDDAIKVTQVIQRKRFSIIDTNLKIGKKIQNI